MKKYVMGFCIVWIAASVQAGPDQAASGVLQRTLGSRAGDFVFQKMEGHDAYRYEAKNGKVIVAGTDGVAMTRGAYDYLRNHRLGMNSWCGNWFNLPAKLPDDAGTRGESPYRHRYLFNVVTYGYTMPYWTWERWEQEIDWMALHGVNLPMALVATEAIGDRVWKKLGLTQQDIDEFHTGPAHLPFNRMGCLAKHDGPLPASWHADQVALQHQILDRMRSLGIEPIVPAFAGFVPKGLKQLHPEITLHEMAWGGFPVDKRCHLLAPGTPLFNQIGKMFVEEWEKEFGKCTYYLSDSFNEMDLPKTGKPVTELLADYGDAIYRSIKAGNPDAVWVIQGWMFGYQRNIWNRDTVRALLSKVPDDKMLILDYANDYNTHFWHNGSNYELFDGFYGKNWIYGFVPNMGGKTAYTGILNFYATGPANALKSPKCGQLVGIGNAGEGTENNEVIYELVFDTAWSRDPINLDDWIARYCACRYGGYSEKMKEAWKLLRESCYGTFTDHPRVGWQSGSTGSGTQYNGPKFHQAVQAFLACRDELGKSPLYRADAVEMAALSLAGQSQAWFAAATINPDKNLPTALQMLTDLDRLLESHPLLRLQRWIDFARAHGSQCEINARRIVTVWGPPVNDYSARLWSGLVRDFYRERMRLSFEDKNFNRSAWEAKWVNATGVSKVDPFPDPVAAAARLVKEASEKVPNTARFEGEIIGRWLPGQMKTDWITLEWPLTTDQLKKLKGVHFRYDSGNHRLEAQSVAVIADGVEIARETHDGYAGAPSSRNTYRLKLPANVRANNGAVLRVICKSGGGTDSTGSVLLVTE